MILFCRTRVKTLWAGGVSRATREQEAGRSKPEESFSLKTNDGVRPFVLISRHKSPDPAVCTSVRALYTSAH